MSKKINYILIVIVSFSFIIFEKIYAQKIGEVIPGWSAGYLDIHFINTGKGECSFCILPDGTTLLVDAGATTRPEPRITDPRPNGSRTPGEWIARYITKMLTFKSETSIDYVLLSHFHGDHIGLVDSTMKMSPSGAYRLSGITEVAEYIKFHKIIDRGWPDYNYPVPLNLLYVNNYRRFLQYQRSENNLDVQRFRTGLNDQIILLKNPKEYPGFEIRNVAANGEIWTSVGENTRHHFPPIENIPREYLPSENMCSIAFRLSYGTFDYFTGGDIVGVPDEGAPLWHDVETPVAKAVGPVDVNELNHHGYLDSENAFFLSALRPRVHIIQVWSPSHPSPRVLRRLLSERIYPGPRDIFATNMMEANKVVIGNNLKKLKSDQGHIVVRVHPGGESYHVIILDDSAENFMIKAVHGPYQSR